jgi:hypothetical protein
MKKPFVVTKKVSFVVLADSIRDAEREAEYFAEEAMSSEDRVMVCELTDLKQLPVGWNSDTLVFHQGREDVTVADAINAVRSPGAAGETSGG